MVDTVSQLSTPIVITNTPLSIPTLSASLPILTPTSGSKSAPALPIASQATLVNENTSTTTPLMRIDDILDALSLDRNQEGYTSIKLHALWSFISQNDNLTYTQNWANELPYLESIGEEALNLINAKNVMAGMQLQLTMMIMEAKCMGLVL